MKNAVLEGADRILVTGANGFIGKRVVQSLLDYGFRNIRALTRLAMSPASSVEDKGDSVEILQGNLLSPGDCLKATKDVKVVYHLAAGRGEKSFPDAYYNSVVSTRNLLDACVKNGPLRRFVNVSSFTVYTNNDKPQGRLLDEGSPVETRPTLRGNAYCFAKVKQEELAIEYARKYRLPLVTVRPGVVYGPGNEQIHGRVGIGTFGLFLHLGGSNPVPLTYVDNCADAIVLAGITPGIEGEVFNVVDDDLPSSRDFLRMYKRDVKQFRSIYVPQWMSYLLCLCWEKYCAWSHDQLPNLFNRRAWRATWKKTTYSNDALKSRLGWSQRVSTPEGLQSYFAACRDKLRITAPAA